MQWASSLSESPATADALAAVVAEIRSTLEGCAPDLVLLFVSPHHDYGAACEGIAGAWPAASLLGCSARSVIGAGREVEDAPGLALAAAQLPGVEISCFHRRNDELPDPNAGPRPWREGLALGDGAEPSFLLLADPFTCDPQCLIDGLDASFPRAAKIGGLASAGDEAGQNALFLGRRVHREGVVGAALCGNVQLDTIVAQGCRPIGNPMFVTRAQENVLFEVDGMPPGELLQSLHDEASPRDRELFRTSLFLGIEMREALEEYRGGDFLIRNLVEMDPRSGAMVVAALLHDRQVVQFHLRDARASAQDLDERLGSYRADIDREQPPAGALLFSCLGRGRHLYGQPNHDSNAFRRHLGEVPLAGFFCNGEIGPVQGQTFLHGYTSAFGIFRPARGLH